MFEKRLKSFTYAVGITFLILAAVTAVTYIWLLLLIGGALNGIPALAGMPVIEFADYLLNLKLLAVIFGAIFLTCSIWHRKLRAEAN